jgi:uncharacterized protein YfiM (DUF2279 family)
MMTTRRCKCECSVTVFCGTDKVSCTPRNPKRLIQGRLRRLTRYTLNPFSPGLVSIFVFSELRSAPRCGYAAVGYAGLRRGCRIRQAVNISLVQSALSGRRKERMNSRRTGFGDSYVRAAWCWQFVGARRCSRVCEAASVM